MLASFLGGIGLGVGWLNHRLDLPTPTVDLSIETGESARDVAIGVADAGVSISPALLYWWFRLSGESRKIKAGSYELDRDTTPRSLLRKLVQGEEAMRSVTLVEGWTFQQVRMALKNAEQLKSQTQDLSPEAIMVQLGKSGVHPEGRFFPDTYTYSKGSSDLAVLQRAMRAMDKRLAAAWAQRAPQSPLKSPEQALALASIVEKETGRTNDRALIAAVFSNRLRIGMRLQTDPSVIYGLGASFDGNLRKIDLQTDTPWNTYTRVGLPPTPIAMPGKASLLAAVQPAHSNALYFVAKGDGSSQFSATLDEHNRAVNKYQRGQ
ncbi:MAG: aminodeoxychorismate lyase [Burkholderiales bacterium RIFCSPLOWO2_12_FULL_61_40]|nr:MAG: aminodeoxychorismate lyase [Burkholderiales bacterium RIFCSPLOWO2_12_FULL_61_40]